MKNIKYALIHIQHELEMFSQLTFYLEQREIPFAPFQKNSMLDSWLIHFRNIYDFLRSDINNKNKDDIFASDFFPHINWENTRKKFSKYLYDNYVKINKMCAHLSYERIELVEQGKNEWHIMRMYLELAEVFNHFASTYNEDVNRIYSFLIKPMPLDLESIFAEKMEHSPIPPIVITSDVISK